jgi:CubicO group peptidase (beta-lactamase class C family)
MTRHTHGVSASVALLLACSTAAPGADAQTLTPDAIRALPAVLDQAVAKEMADRHVVGSAVGVVHDGRVIYLRGFGEPTLGSGQPVDPSRTLFRIGSVTKLLTAIAVMQQVDAGTPTITTPWPASWSSG